MVKGIFILGKEFYVCSTEVIMDFGKKPYSTFLAKNCFGTGLKELDMAECLLKYTDAAPVKFTGCIRKISGNNDVLISVASPLKTSGIPQIISEITRLVEKRLYLLREES